MERGRRAASRYHCTVCAMALGKLHTGAQCSNAWALSVASCSRFASCTALGALRSSHCPGQCLSTSVTSSATVRFDSCPGPKLKALSKEVDSERLIVDSCSEDF